MNKPKTLQEILNAAAELSAKQNLSSLMDFCSKTLRISTDETAALCLSLGCQIKFATIEKRTDIDPALLELYQQMQGIAYAAFDANSHLREPS